MPSYNPYLGKKTTTPKIPTANTNMGTKTNLPPPTTNKMLKRFFLIAFIIGLTALFIWGLTKMFKRAGGQGSPLPPPPPPSMQSPSAVTNSFTGEAFTVSDFFSNFPISLRSSSSQRYGYGLFGSGYVSFITTGNGLTIVTDGDPFPVPAGSGSTLSNTTNSQSTTADPRGGYGGGAVIGKNENWTFTIANYYGGVALASLPTAGSGTTMYIMGTVGVSANGVVLYTPYAASLVQYPYNTFCTGTNYPNYGFVITSPLIINPVYCATRYLVDDGGGHPTGASPGKTDNYQYHYHDGMFLYMFELNDSVMGVPQAPTLYNNSVVEGPLMYPLASPYPNFTPNYNVNILSSYFKTGYYTDPSSGAIDYFRHPDGHSKIIGVSLDGFPIYGPYGYNAGVSSSTTSSPTTTSTPSSSYVVIMQSSYIAYNEHSFYSTYFTSSSTVYSVSSSGGNANGQNATSYTSYIPTGTGAYFAVTNNQTSAPTTTITSLPSGSISRMPLSIQSVSDVNLSNPQTGPTGCISSSYQYTQYGSNSSTSTNYYVEPDGITIQQAMTSTTSSSSGGQSSNKMVSTIAAAPMGSIAQDYFYDWNLPSKYNGTTSSSPYFLDQFNGKFGPTPDYPDGTYAYYLTYTYPFIFAPTLRNSMITAPVPQTTTSYLS